MRFIRCCRILFLSSTCITVRVFLSLSFSLRLFLWRRWGSNASYCVLGCVLSCTCALYASVYAPSAFVFLFFFAFVVASLSLSMYAYWAHPTYRCSVALCFLVCSSHSSSNQCLRTRHFIIVPLCHPFLPLFFFSHFI